MNNLKSIDEVLSLSNQDYENYIRSILKKNDAIYTIDILDDELLNVVVVRPDDVARICQINAIVFAKYNKRKINRRLIAYNFNTYMVATIYQKKIELSKKLFLNGIAFCKANKQYEAGKSLSKNVFRLFESNQIALDEAPYFLVHIKDFYNTLKKHQDAIDAFCAAAFYFADVSAFQSAYRAIHDAQEIVLKAQDIEINKENITWQIKVLETQGIVALREKDFDCANNEFEKCFKIHELINTVPSLILETNAATVKLKTKDFKAAKEIYTRLISDYPSELFNIQIKINLLVCSRELGDIEHIENLSKDIETTIAECDLDVRIEARLVLARTYFHISNLAKGIDNLKQSCIEIQSEIDKYQRLHYRRGVREQYVSRIQSMLLSFEPSGMVDDILYALVLCSSNSLADWLSVLEWIDYVLQSETVSISLKNELVAKRDNLISHGTPFIYGFSEKYDDPFEFLNEKLSEKFGEQMSNSLDYSFYWREFNDLTARICLLYSFPSPFEGASIQQVVDVLNSKLSSYSAFLFSFICDDSCVFFLLTKEKYIIETIPVEQFFDFYDALFKYQHNVINRPVFNDALNSVYNGIKLILIKFVSILENSSISEFMFIPDHWTEGLPILPSIIESDQLRSRMRESEFVFKTCPVIKEALTYSLVTGSNLLIFNSADNLRLAESEKDLIKKAFADQNSFEIDLQYEEVDFSKPPANSTDFLHLATHSLPANIFTDPFFVSTSIDTAKNGVWLESVQREVHKLNLKLVFLNGCNTGTTSNKNYFKNFSTNEKVGLSSIFLLNRKCTVIATQWNQPDIIGYIFAALFYKCLANQPNPVKAYNLAIVDLYELNKEGVIALLEENLDEKARQKWCHNFKQSQNEFPFRHAYCLAMFQCHSLLMP